MAMRLKHIGAESFYAERKAILDDYDKAKGQTKDDLVKVDHGHTAESLWRDWLRKFLPKRFGVTKGYIITSSLKYEGPLEEWDVLIYDRLESPVLFARGGPKSPPEETRLAIPVEHVRGVVEVKATLNVSSAKEVREKLDKLRGFVGTNNSTEYPEFLMPPFACSAVFFETAVKDSAEYKRSLSQLVHLCEGPTQPFGFLVLRSQNHPDHCAMLHYIEGDQPLGLDLGFEVSDEVPLKGKHVILGNMGMGWGVNFFAFYMFGLVRAVAGTLNQRMPSFYGLDLG